jgi:hypothetical protein
MFEGTRSLMNIFVGLVLFILGLIPLLFTLKLIPFSIPNIPLMLMQIFLGAAGFYLMIDGFMVIMVHPVLSATDILGGLAIASFGMIPLLNNLTGALIAMSFITMTVNYICLMVAGILMMITSMNF